MGKGGYLGGSSVIRVTEDGTIYGSHDPGAEKRSNRKSRKGRQRSQTTVISKRKCRILQADRNRLLHFSIDLELNGNSEPTALPKWVPEVLRKAVELSGGLSSWAKSNPEYQSRRDRKARESGVPKGSAEKSLKVEEPLPPVPEHMNRPPEVRLIKASEVGNYRWGRIRPVSERDPKADGTPTAKPNRDPASLAKTRPNPVAASAQRPAARTAKRNKERLRAPEPSPATKKSGTTLASTYGSLIDIPDTRSQQSCYTGPSEMVRRAGNVDDKRRIDWNSSSEDAF